MTKRVSNPPPPLGAIRPPAPPGPPQIKYNGIVPKYKRKESIMERKIEGKNIVLGRKYRDSVLTDIEGVAASYHMYLTGCDQVGLSRVVNGERKTEWVDITRIEGVEVKEEDQKPGGPAEHPPS